MISELTPQNINMPHLSQDMFELAQVKNNDSEKISRPVIGYWKDAFLRLSRNKLAMASAIVIFSVGMLGIVGPFSFPSSTDGQSYENVQDSDNKSQSPTWGVPLVVVDEFFTEPEPVLNPNFNVNVPLVSPESPLTLEGIKVVGKPITSGVTLEWSQNIHGGISGYKIFRALSTVESPLEPSVAAQDPSLRGFEIADLTNPAQVSYTDAAGLDPAETYVYTVAPYVTNTETLETTVFDKGQSVLVNMEKTIILSRAQEINSEAKVGDIIPGRAHLFGTDALGRDILARMIQGTRIDFFLALLVPAVSLFIGLFYGALSGLVGGKVDMVLMRIIEIIDSMPELLMFILLQVALGKGLTSLIIALSAFSWTGYARILRGEVLRLREIEFVHASRLLGASLPKLVLKHIAPNLLGVIIVLASAHIPRVISFEAFLSILGLGVEAPMASWGTVLQEAGEKFQVYPMQFFLPAALMGITLLAFFLLGDALRDAFDPKLRGRE
jgi:oligopeptide transport system permease protein